MSRTDVDIANRAIEIVGGLSITTLADSTKSARAMNRAYTPVLESLLNKHNWSFAKKRVALVASVTDPVYEYGTAFNLPTDYIKLISVYPKNIVHKVEGAQILANADTLSILYISKITDPTKFTPEFAELFSMALAKETVYSITQSRALQADLRNEFIKYFRWASSNDSKGSGTPDIFADDVWIASRGYGTDTNTNAVTVEGTDYGTVS